MKIAEAVWEMPPDCGPDLYDDTFWPRMDALTIFNNGGYWV